MGVGEAGRDAERGYKYEGLGNDFVLLDRRASGEDISPRAARALCDRRRGVGADGVLVLLPSRVAAARMVVHNADGSVAEMCGNGLRCVVKHLLDGHPAEDTLAIETGAGVLSSRVNRRDGAVDEVEVELGPARLTAPNLPLAPGGGPFRGVRVEGVDFPGTAVNLGNPHLVLLGAPQEVVREQGPRLEHLPGFPERTNVEAVRRAHEGLSVWVWERGAGLTDACGTGAGAAVVAALLAGWVSPDVFVPVELPGGRLAVRVAADLGRTTLRGPARFVFGAELPEALFR
jgi:diaminopimelate epimerase